MNEVWQTSSFCGGGACVEVAVVDDVEGDPQPPRVFVRDGKDRNDGPLIFDAEAWRAFISSLKGQR
jgi:hypothetical protein